MNNKILSNLTKPFTVIAITVASLVLGTKAANVQSNQKQQNRETTSFIYDDDTVVIVKQPTNIKDRFQTRRKIATCMRDLTDNTRRSLNRILDNYVPNAPVKKRFAVTNGVISCYRAYLVEYNDLQQVYYNNVILKQDKKGNQKERVIEKAMFALDGDLTKIKFNIDNEFVKYNGRKDSLIYKPAYETAKILR